MLLLLQIGRIWFYYAVFKNRITMSVRFFFPIIILFKKAYWLKEFEIYYGFGPRLNVYIIHIYRVSTNDLFVLKTMCKDNVLKDIQHTKTMMLHGKIHTLIKLKPHCWLSCRNAFLLLWRKLIETHFWTLWIDLDYH